MWLAPVLASTFSVPFWLCDRFSVFLLPAHKPVFVSHTHAYSIKYIEVHKPTVHLCLGPHTHAGTRLYICRNTHGPRQSEPLHTVLSTTCFTLPVNSELMPESHTAQETFEPNRAVTISSHPGAHEHVYVTARTKPSRDLTPKK